MKLIKYLKSTQEPIQEMQKPAKQIKYEISWYYARNLLQILQSYSALVLDKEFALKLKNLVCYIETKIPFANETGKIVDEYVIVEVY